MSVTLRGLFDRIAGTAQVLTQGGLQTFVEGAGVSNSFLLPKASLAARSFMDKFDDGSGNVSWDRFRKRGMALVPAGLVSQVDAKRIAAEVDARWAQIDPTGSGAVDVKTLSSFLEAQLAARGASFAGTKAEAGAQVLVHALDDNHDSLLQKDELRGFLLDVAAEALRP